MAGYQTVAHRNMTCAIRIKERRRQLGLTQAEVVNWVSSHGSHLSNQALSAIENGRRLAVGRLPDLADALDCTVTYLLGLTADPHRWPPDAQIDTHRWPPDTQAEPHRWPPDAQTDTQASEQTNTQTDTHASKQAAEQTGEPPGAPRRLTAADAPSPPRHRRPAARDPAHSSRHSWILGPDVPEPPGEVRSQARDASTIPRPR